MTWLQVILTTVAFVIVTIEVEWEGHHQVWKWLIDTALWVAALAIIWNGVAT